MGASDSHGPGDIGCPQTYFQAHSDEPARFAEAELASAIHRGRALVSAGAFARILLDARGGLGDTVTDTDGVVDLRVRIEAIPEIDVTHFKIFRNCDEVLSVPASSPGEVVKFDGVVSLPVSADANLVVVGFGKQRLPRGLASFDPARIPRFVTNLVYVDADGNGRYDPPGGKKCAYRI